MSKKRAAAYKRLFLDAQGNLTPDAEIVFADWIRFARVKTCTHVRGDSDTSKLLEGRREFFNRVWSFLSLDLKSVYGVRDDADRDDVSELDR